MDGRDNIVPHDVVRKDEFVAPARRSVHGRLRAQFQKILKRRN